MPDRKPLILRGARQTGKTTLVNNFANEFEQYVQLNLEKSGDRQLFHEDADIGKIVQSIFLAKSKILNGKKTLLFIDEIQYSPTAIKMLRYFYEEYPQLYVIAAGSLLESILDFKESFPVGRVLYEYLHPFTFEEYLLAMDKNGLAEGLSIIPYPKPLTAELMKEYSIYALIGGMPAVIKAYKESGDIYSLRTIFESLLVSYLDDVQKYAGKETQAELLRHIIQASFREAGKRITMQGFGNSQYKSREVKEAFAVLEKTMLLRLVYPSSSVRPPVTPSLNKSPKLMVLDTGLMNFYAGIQKEFAYESRLEDIYTGSVAEHLTGQELTAVMNSQIHSPVFWTREKTQSSAEVDYLYPFEDKLIPIEVKSGKAGRLRSLMQFMDAAPHNLAVRVYSGELTLNEVSTPSGKRFLLLNLPFFLTAKIGEYLQRLDTLMPHIKG